MALLISGDTVNGIKRGVVRVHFLRISRSSEVQCTLSSLGVSQADATAVAGLFRGAK